MDVDQLIKAGANVNAANKDGTTALMAATKNGKHSIIKLLNWNDISFFLEQDMSKSSDC